MKDAFGTKIEIGDTVAFNPPTYKGLITGTVVAFTPKMVRVAWVSYPSHSTETTVVYPRDCVVDMELRRAAKEDEAQEAMVMKFTEIDASPAFEKNHELSYNLDGFVSYDVDTENYVVVVKDEDNIRHIVLGITHEKDSDTITIITSNDDVQFTATLDEELKFATFKRVTF